MKGMIGNGGVEGGATLSRRSARRGLLTMSLMAVMAAGCEETADPFYNHRVVVRDQSVADGTVVLESVETNTPGGWVVVRRDDGSGAPVSTETIGRAHVDFGVSGEMSITLTETVAAGETLWVVLHHDTGVSGTFDYTGEGSADPPVTSRGSGIVVMGRFTTL